MSAIDTRGRHETAPSVSAKTRSFPPPLVISIR
jgi:hypothetical protein